MTLAQAIVDRARLTLIDAAKVSWSDAELLGYLNAGIAQACSVMLDAYVKTSVTALVAGVRQSLPADGLVLIDIPRNSAGGGVTQQAINELARVHPSFAADTAGATRYYMYDARAPLTFMVYPPAVAAATVEIVYGATPAPITLADPILISTWYDTPLWAYVLGMAYAKNSLKQDLVKTKDFMVLFSSALEQYAKAKATKVAPVDVKGVH